MKKLLYMAIFALPLATHTMEEKQLSEKDAESLWWDTALPLKKYGTQSLPYSLYKENMIKALESGAKTVQHHYHNPLIDAIVNRDYAFTKFLLEHGASPAFRGMNMISGFDALRLQLGKDMVDNPATKEQLEELLQQYTTETKTAYPLAGVNACFITNEELEQQRREKEQKFD